MPVEVAPILNAYSVRESVDGTLPKFYKNNSGDRIGFQNDGTNGSFKNYQICYEVVLDVARGSTIHSFGIDVVPYIFTSDFPPVLIKKYQDAINPPTLVDYTDFHARTKVGTVQQTMPAPMQTTYVNWTPEVQALVNRADFNKGDRVLLFLTTTNQLGPTPSQYSYFRGISYATVAERPVAYIDYTVPKILGSLNGALPILQGSMKGTTAVPQPIAGTLDGALPTLKGVILVGHSDYSKNVPTTVYRRYANSHHLVTEAGEVYGVSASFDPTLGGVREEVLASGDGSWFPASNLPTRSPAPLTFRATLLDRLLPRLETDRFVRALPKVREIHYPDGRILGLWRGDFSARPTENVVELSLQPKSAHPRELAELAEVSAAFPTKGSTPELPIYSFDTAGYIKAPLLPTRVDQGTICFGVRLNARGALSLVSLGEPIDALGQAVLESINVSYQGEALVVHLWGQETRIRERYVGTFGAVLVIVLTWTAHTAQLVTVSDLGLRVHEPFVGPPLAPSVKQVTVGTRSGGGSFALGTASTGTPLFSLRPMLGREAEAAAKRLYGLLTAPTMTWEVEPPELSLVLSRLDNKALNLAPGETITLDFAALRVGPFTGDLIATVASSEGINVSVSTLTVGTAQNTYRATISAPAGSSEGRYTFRIVAKAVGADEPDSLLVDVRDDLGYFIEVAAGPAIMPNATYVRKALDPTLKRASEMLLDASANANVSNWAGLARPNREYTGLLATGRYGAHVYTGALANAVQAQRMNANQTFCVVFREVAKTPVNGIMYQVAASDSENGVHLIRVDGGFKIRTVDGASSVTSPDTLPWPSGDGNAWARLAIVIDTSVVSLYDRATGRSITLARPAWVDAGVRTTLGALRSAAGAASSVTRAHLLADSAHPYALSELQRRRNIDQLLTFCPDSDNKGEFPDNAYGIFLWDDGARKYVNDAAPALAIAGQAIGTVDAITGGVFPRGSSTSASYVLVDTTIPSSSVISILTSVLDFKGGHVTPYESQVGISDSNVKAGSGMLAKHENGQPFAMIRDTDLSHTYATVAYKPGAGDELFKIKLLPSSDALEVTALANGAVKKVSTSNSYTGTWRVTLGAILRADAVVDRRTQTKNRGLIICRDDVSANDVSVAKALLPG